MDYLLRIGTLMKNVKFNKVIIWGYPINTHTHSYIHAAFYKAFKFLGYDTFWYTDQKFDSIDYNNCLFIAAGEQEKNIPLNKNSYYLLHNVNCKRYLEAGCNVLQLQTHTSSIPKFTPKDTVFNKYAALIAGDVDCLFMCWATDLLPHEINIDDARNEKNNRECVWIGTYGDSKGCFQNGTELEPFFNECEKNNIKLKKINPWSTPISFEENRKLVRNSYISPTIQGPWQIENEYIPCRIFKHISYGHFGYTNSKAVDDIFDNTLIYDRDAVKLFYKAIECKNSQDHLNRLQHLMQEVKEKHTYINRIQTIIDCLPE